MRLLAVVLFLLLAVTGVTALGRGVDGVAVPMVVAGLAGAAVAVVSRTPRWVRPAQSGAVGAAVILVVAGALLAPSGAERGFVIGVDLLVGGLLVAFALLALPRSDSS
ncbi:hypothetical protein GCM10010168_24840 [Actinoplanes ianthinogenes]|uniref:Histidine kinase n=1 Tax=Actinoplanes ianthinogenes TaxID=122358 RepID=A0ABN6CTS6_9ACTN|nr:hypothetical protein [Actinoplanes ianthinogenes]BCJ48124.1 hypothetical protein Aiant_87810 [Actinoplanes ianthinogenes]GGR06592.1 hypothetical protein GCM10010168_24840 [Actinoplanes ianthinogenes]